MVSEPPFTMVFQLFYLGYIADLTMPGKVSKPRHKYLLCQRCLRVVLAFQPFTLYKKSKARYTSLSLSQKKTSLPCRRVKMPPIKVLWDTCIFVSCIILTLFNYTNYACMLAEQLNISETGLSLQCYAFTLVYIMARSLTSSLSRVGCATIHWPM